MRFYNGSKNTYNRECSYGENVEQSFMEPVRKTNLSKTKWKLENPFINLQIKNRNALTKEGISFIHNGFLLGRALILATLTPFSLPFFATVYLIRRDKAPLTLIGIIAGAATLSITDALSTFAITVFFIVIYRITKKWLQNEVKLLPFHVFIDLINWKSC